MALNYLYLMSDTGKQGEVTALATVIATVLLIPEGAEVISQLILLAWAAGESTVDLRTLLSGRRAPVLKSAENWQLPLSSLLTLGSSAQRLSGNDTEGRISYEDYLRMFLFLGNTDDITMRPWIGSKKILPWNGHWIISGPTSVLQNLNCRTKLR